MKILFKPSEINKKFIADADTMSVPVTVLVIIDDVYVI